MSDESESHPRHNMPRLLAGLPRYLEGMTMEQAISVLLEWRDTKTNARFGRGYRELALCYESPETDAEYADRIENERRAAVRDKKNARAEIARLKQLRKEAREALPRIKKLQALMKSGA